MPTVEEIMWSPALDCHRTLEKQKSLETEKKVL